MKKTISIFFLLLFFMIINSCSTIRAKYEIEGNIKKKFLAKNESEILVKENYKKELTAEMHSDFIFGTAIIGELKKEDNTDDLMFNVKKINFMTSWENGYTEGECLATGKIIFKKKNSYFESTVVENLEIMEAVKGEIRYDTDYFKGDEGKKRFANRIDRITEVVKFLKTKNLKEFYGNPIFKSKYGEPFIYDTKPILFPELFGFRYLKQKNMPDKNYNLSELDKLIDLSLADGMIWRKSYTDEVFPENLHKIRDSGEMWKDYEEAIEIFSAIYNLDYFFNKIINNSKWKNVK
jgi:hypothetical protein